MRPVTIAILGSLLAAARPAAAEPYVSAQLGYATTDWPRGAPLNGRIDDRALGLGLDLGVAFGERWAFEVGGYRYGGFDARGTPCTGGAVCSPVITEIGGNDITILKAALAPRFVIGNVRVFGTFGYYRATLDTNLDLPEAKSRDRGALLGAGVRWYFRDPWSVSLQATRFDSNLQQLMLGIGWGLRRDRDSAE